MHGGNLGATEQQESGCGCERVGFTDEATGMKVGRYNRRRDAGGALNRPGCKTQQIAGGAAAAAEILVIASS